MRLTGSEIKEQIIQKRIVIEPFDESQLGPNSYDVRLAPVLYEVHTSGHTTWNWDTGTYNRYPLDLKKECAYQEIVIPESGYELRPGRFYLGVTKEFTATDHYLPIIDGRSSCARYGMTIHQTAGFGDIGFSGHWTLEITVALPLIIYPNIRCAQVSFEEVKGKIINYKTKGNYINEYSNNPRPKIGKPGNFS